MLETLAEDLKAWEIKGFTAATASCARVVRSVRFFPRFDIHCLSNSHHIPIRGTASPEFRRQCRRYPRNCLRQGSSRPPHPIRQTLSAESLTPLSPEALLRLSWSHLVEFIAIEDLAGEGLREELRVHD